MYPYRLPESDCSQVYTKKNGHKCIWRWIGHYLVSTTYFNSIAELLILQFANYYIWCRAKTIKMGYFYLYIHDPSKKMIHKLQYWYIHVQDQLKSTSAASPHLFSSNSLDLIKLIAHLQFRYLYEIVQFEII